MARFMYYRLDDYSGKGLERIYHYLDHLHDVASEGHITEITNWSATDVIQWLTEIRFIADETIREIQEHEARRAAALRDIHPE